MNRRSTITILTGILAIAMISLTGYSQNHFGGPRNMGAILNSADQEIAPTISPNGLSLYLASNRSGGQGGNDLWVSQRATLSSPWGVPQNLGPTLNTDGNENAPAFSLDGRTMFFAGDRPDSLGGPDIYTSTRLDPNNDFGWGPPVNLAAVVNSTSNEIAPNYFEDPATGLGTLIFSSNRVGNPQFDFHLYQSTRNANGSFNAPTLINELSSVGNGAELRSAIRRDGLEIFFASARPGGLGPPPPATATFDTFVSTRASISAPWSTPVLVPGVNTAGDERNPSLSPDGSILYFQSNNAGGMGGIDLYAATRCSLYTAGAPCGINRTVADFNGDGQTDLAVFRPGDGTWHAMFSGTNEYRVQQFGSAGDQPVDGDFDGDGRNDIAIFRPGTGDWWIVRSSDNSTYAVHWGLGTDRLVPGDYDADRRTDPAVYRDGTWYILQSSNGQLNQRQFGLASDVPITGVQ